MNLKEQGENINNAFLVVAKTYENVNKMLNCIDNLADDFNFMTITPRFLRWKSDADTKGYYTASFIKLYQSKSLPNHSSLDMKNGPVYVVEVVFTEHKTPKIIISKYIYDDINNWSWIPSGGDGHRIFNQPIRNKDKCTETDIDEKYKKKIFTNEKYIKSNWGIREVIYTDLDLLDIDNEEAIKEKIFKCFGELDKYDVETST